MNEPSPSSFARVRAMPIRFRCPDCETTLSIATRKAGAQIACPKCGEDVLVPAPGSEPEIDLADEGNHAGDPAGRDGSATAAAVVARVPPPVKFEKPDFARPAVAAEPASVEVEAVTVPAEEGLFVSRKTAALLVTLAAALVGLAFATGYLVGR